MAVRRVTGKDGVIPGYLIATSNCVNQPYATEEPSKPSALQLQAFKLQSFSNLNRTEAEISSNLTRRCGPMAKLGAYVSGGAVQGTSSDH